MKSGNGAASNGLNRRKRMGKRSVSLMEPGEISKGGGKITKKPETIEEETKKTHSQPSQNDTFNYILLLILYTIQGIPLGLSASIPFLIQQRLKTNAYNAQAIFALSTWPFSLKLLWAPIVDAIFWKRVGRRKSWLFPTQFIAGSLLVWGSVYVEKELMSSSEQFDVTGITAYFFSLYFLMATQDIATDGWALTMLSKENRGRGPVCNSIGQNFGYFLSFVGFLALNDVDSSENLWRPLFRMKPQPGVPLVSLASFMRFMGIFILAVTIAVGLFKSETEDQDSDKDTSSKKDGASPKADDDDEPAELDASEIGLVETYQRLWAVCSLPAVRSLFVILLTYRFPVALSDNVKFLKAVEYGLSKQTTALLGPALVLPLGIAVPILAAKIWQGHPLKQFLSAYKLRITFVPLMDILMLLMIKSVKGNLSTEHSFTEKSLFWFSIIMSTASQATMNALQFNAQMTFFASRVDPAIGGSYMTLLNTAANLGGTWPSSVVMYLVGKLTVPAVCHVSNGIEICEGGKDGYFPLQAFLTCLGFLWVLLLGNKVIYISELPESAWRTRYFKRWAIAHHFKSSVRKLIHSMSFAERGEKKKKEQLSSRSDDNSKVI